MVKLRKIIKYVKKIIHLIKVDKKRKHDEIKKEIIINDHNNEQSVESQSITSFKNINSTSLSLSLSFKDHNDVSTKNVLALSNQYRI